MTPIEFVKWFTKGTGQLSSAGPVATGIFSSEINKARGEGDWPDIQLFLLPFAMFRGASAYLAHAFSIKLDEMKKYYDNSVGRDACHVIVSGARPFSRGYIELGGSSPYDNPIIEPNYLGDPGDRDFQALLDGVKKTLILMENTTTFGVKLGARFTNVRLPGCEHLKFRSDPYWECYIRRYSASILNAFDKIKRFGGNANFCVYQLFRHIAPPSWFSANRICIENRPESIRHTKSQSH